MLITYSIISTLLLTAQPVEDTTNINRSKAMDLAAETATIAGGAQYCQLEADVVESFIALAKSKVAAEADDQVDLVVSQVEFNNILAKAASSEPEGGCDAFTDYFEAQMLRLSRS